MVLGLGTLLQQMPDCYIATTDARLTDHTQVYWVEPVLHQGFSKAVQNKREKFIVCVNAVTKVFDNMHCLKIRDPWCNTDCTLVVNDRIKSLKKCQNVKKMSKCQIYVKLSKRYQVVKKMSNVKKSNIQTMEEVHKKNKFT